MSFTNIQELLSACHHVSRLAGGVIKQVMEDGQMQASDKSAEGKEVKVEDMYDPQTIADIRAQKLIYGSLRKVFPELKIIGEEGELTIEDEWVKDASVDVLSKHTFPAELASVDTSRLVVWVDPMDGTKEFTEGIKEAVTTLIGVALDGRPVAGIIHRPFSQETIWGCVGVGAFGFNKPEAVPDVKRRYVACSRSHFKADIKEYIGGTAATGLVRAGGAGGKALMCMEGTADAYLHPSKGTKRWDSCAPEAVLLAMGGCLSKPSGELYDYAADVNPHNAEGLVATAYHGKAFHDSFLRPNLVPDSADIKVEITQSKK